MQTRTVPTLIVMLCLFLPPGLAAAQSSGTAPSSGAACPPLVRQYGPYDYLNPSHRTRFLGAVERRHFTDKVKSLHRHGETGSLIGDLNYTLNWFPNHHGALDVLSRLAVREKNPKPLGANVPIECRFQWARQVNARDQMVPMIEGVYLHRLGKNAEARRILEAAVEMAPQDATIHYNLGLVLFQLKDYEAAREQAREAYELGFPLPGLRNMLAKAGYPLAD